MLTPSSSYFLFCLFFFLLSFRSLFSALSVIPPEDCHSPVHSVLCVCQKLVSSLFFVTLGHLTVGVGWSSRLQQYKSVNMMVKKRIPHVAAIKCMSRFYTTHRCDLAYKSCLNLISTVCYIPTRYNIT